MKITVCVKQVPDTADIKWTENNTLNRDGVESVINPFDAFAVETALRIKDYYDTEITAISMGPLQAKECLSEVIAMGVDNAFLLSDKFFAGSDTAATARVLAAAINSKLKDTDIIFCGQYATDGDTAQTGPSLAQNLGISLVTSVKEIERIKDKYVIVKKHTDDGFERVQVTLPAVICMLKCDYEVRIPKITGRIKAQNTEIPVYNAADIEINIEKTGFKGSPTYVKRAFRPQERVQGEIISGKPADELADLILNKIEEIKKE